MPGDKLPDWEEYTNVYKQLMGPQGQGSQFAANNPFLAPSQGGQLPQQNAFSRILPNHARIADALDNAFMMMATTPERDTIGGNIAGVAQAFLGLPQAKLQRDVAMYGPAQEWEKSQADIASKKMGAFGSFLQGRYWAERPDIERSGQEADIKKAQIAADARSPYDASEHIDDDGNLWKFNDKARKMEQMTFGGEFLNEKKKERLQTTTEFQRLLSGEMMEDINNQRATRNEPLLTQEQTVDLYMKSRGALAGATAGGAFGATAPGRDVVDFINQQESKVYEGIEKENPSYANWMVNRKMADPTANTSQTSFDSYKTDIRNKRAEADTLFGLYRRSAAPKAGVSFSDWKATRPAATAAPKSAGGKTWNPQTGRYE